MSFLGSQLNKKPRMIWSQGLCSAAVLAEDFQGDMFQHLGHQEAGRSQSQLQPLPDRKRNRVSLALLLHGAPWEPGCFCVSLTVPLSSAHMSLPHLWIPTALSSMMGNQRAKKFAQGHTAEKLKNRLEVPAWALLGPLVSPHPGPGPSLTRLSNPNHMPHLCFTLRIQSPEGSTL